MTREKIVRVTVPMLTGLAGAILSGAVTLWAVASNAEARLVKIEAKVADTDAAATKAELLATRSVEKNDVAHTAILAQLEKLNRRQSAVLIKLGIDPTKIPD